MAKRDAPEVRLLFGPGAFVRMNQPGRFDTPATFVDLTWVAEDLCRAGIRLARTVPEPAEVTSDIEGDLGDGGRAMWIDGGGDIGIVEVLWAIAAALEQLAPGDVIAIFQARQRSLNMRLFTAIETALDRTGLSRRQISGLLRRPRHALGGRRAVDMFDQMAVDPHGIQAVIDLTVDSVRTLAGPAGVRVYLQALTEHPAVSKGADSTRAR